MHELIISPFLGTHLVLRPGQLRPGNGPTTASLARSRRGSVMNDGSPPQVHPAQRVIAPDGTPADIDTDIVPLVQALWALNLATTASCQDFGEGVAGQRAAVQRPSRYGADAFIAYHAGYAWLKMPVPDAIRLVDALTGTEFRDQVTRRWTPGSWRVHVPVIVSEHAGTRLAATAQIHFPRQQVPRLTSVLEDMRT